MYGNCMEVQYLRILPEECIWKTEGRMRNAVTARAGRRTFEDACRH